MEVLDSELRRRIVFVLRDGELNAGEIARRLELHRPTLSHHLGELVLAKLLLCRHERAFRYYRLDRANVLAAWDTWVNASRRSPPRALPKRVHVA
jgi:DNA-binding transcriptional ArsR family regulator